MGILDKRAGFYGTVVVVVARSRCVLHQVGSIAFRFTQLAPPPPVVVAPSDIEQIRSSPSSDINQLGGLDAVLASQPKLFALSQDDI